MTGDPRIGLVILTHERCAEALGAVERARQLPECPALVVVDNASCDGTADRVAARYPDVTLVRNASNRGAAGRNDGLARLAVRYVAFADDDTAWEPGSLACAADHLDAHPHVAVVSARVLVGADGREDRTCARMRSSPLPRSARDGPGVPVAGFLAGACMARRSAFAAAGGYEPRLFLGAEESLLALDLLAAGWSLHYLDASVVRHWPSAARDAHARRRLLRRNALWVAWLRRRLPVALRATAGALREAHREADLGPLVATTLAVLPWLVRQRRVVPDGVERVLATLEAERTRVQPSGDPPHSGP